MSLSFAGKLVLYFSVWRIASDGLLQNVRDRLDVSRVRGSVTGLSFSYLSDMNGKLTPDVGQVAIEIEISDSRFPEGPIAIAKAVADAMPDGATLDRLTADFDTSSASALVL